MTARPMAEERADELLDAFEDAVRERVEDYMSWRHRVDGPRDEARDALRQALLSLSASERRMREALEGLIPFLDDLDDGAASIGVYPDVTCTKRCRDAVAAARAALSEDEQDQARR